MRDLLYRGDSVIPRLPGGVRVPEEPQGVGEPAQAHELRVVAEPKHMLGSALRREAIDDELKVLAGFLQRAGPERADAEEILGTVVAWGLNGYGQTSVPAGLSGVSAVAAGGYHSLALKSDGTVVAWGYNGNGQTSVPPGLSGVTAVAGGGLHSLALESLAPAVTLSTASIAFGNQSVGTSSGPRPVTVTNTGKSALTIEHISASGDFTASGSCVAKMSVAPGGSCSIDVTFTPSAGGPRSGTLTIDHDAPDAPHEVELTGTGVIEADLGISMGASPNPVRTGTDLTYAITVSNAGPTMAADVTVTDAVPANTQFSSVGPSSGWVCATPPVGSSGTVRCQVPTLAKGSSATIKLVVKVVAAGNNTVTNTATVASPWTDPDTTNNSATVATSTFGRR